MRTSNRAAALALAAGLAVVGAAPPALAQQEAPAGVAAQAAAIIPLLERVSGKPMLLLERTGDDPGQFWYKAMQALCAKTGDNWCEEDLQVLSDTTNLLGWSRVLTYQPRDGGGRLAGGTKTICVILPPKPGISAGFTAIGLAGGGAFLTEELPSDAEAEAFLYLTHAASCAGTDGTGALDTKRADAFAALALTLITGNPAFVSGRAVSPGRKFSSYRSAEPVRWAVSVGERVLFDLWKGQAQRALVAGGCSASVADSAEMDTQAIRRDAALPAGGNCVSRNGWARQGVVSDGNLWLWGGMVGLPPAAYSPFMSFASIEEGVRYSWTTAGTIASQR